MSWCWLAWLAHPVEGTLAHAAVTDLQGHPAGVMAAWPSGRKPVPDAVRMDDRLVDPAGDPAWLSMVLLPRHRSPLFDDPAVSGALRSVLAGPPPDAVSTLVRDSSHFAGAVTLRRLGAELLRDDPFARLGPAVLLRVTGGLFGHVAPPPGPVIQRYSGKPWPAAGFGFHQPQAAAGPEHPADPTRKPLIYRTPPALPV
jgi:hypothetical protein